MGQIFETPGIIQGTPLKQGYTCLAIKLNSDQDMPYFSQAPVIGIRIDQQVDFSLAKTLAGNFNLVTFEDLPVTITLRGIRSLYSFCDANKGQSIGQMYKKLKAASSGQLQAVDITIGGKEQYKAVIVAFTQASSDEAPGILSYNLTLFGVRAK